MTSDPAPKDDAISQLIGREIVIDVASPFIFAGTLVENDHHYLVLEEADVHDLRDTNTTRELYLLDTRRYGIRTNRQRVLVRRRHREYLRPGRRDCINCPETS